MIRYERTVSAGEIQPYTTTFQGHEHDCGVIFGHKRPDCAVALVTRHGSLIPDVCESFISQIPGDEVEVTGPLRDDDGLFGLVLPGQIVVQNVNCTF